MRRLTLASLAALAALAALPGCGGGSSSPGEQGVTARVDTDPFRLTVLRDGEPVVSQAMGGRLRYRLESGEEHRLTRASSSADGIYRVETDEPGRTAEVRVSETPVGIRLSMRLEPETGVAQVYDAWETGPEEHFLGGGEQGEAVDLRGEILAGKVSWVCTHAPVPYVASSAGWALRVDTLNVYALAFPGSSGGTGCLFSERPSCEFPGLADRAEVCVRGARLDLDLYAGSFEETLRDYHARAGAPAVPPPGQFELIKWRDENQSSDELLEDVDRLRAAGIPVGWIILDNPWEPCIGEMTFDPRRIPDPEGLIRQLSERDVRLMLWVSPKLKCPSGYPPEAILGADQDQQTLDLRIPTVMAEFRRRLRNVVELGVAGFKGDRADEVDLEDLAPDYHNTYPILFARAVMDEAPEGAAVILRAAAMGSQSILPGIWAGDQPGDWVGLHRAIRMGQTAAMSGYPTWGSDVGGYSSEQLTPEVFARWAQLGAVSPVMEVGGIGPHATPWVLGEEAMEALRRAAILHYELYPYFRSVIDRGEPVLRPLGYAYPDDPQAWESDLQFLVGPDLLAAPVTGGGTTPSVYLPAGEWVDLHSGGAVEGGEIFVRSTPLDDLPLYLRAGAVIPFNARTADPWWELDELDRADRAGYLATDGAQLDLAGQPEGVQILVPAPVRPGAVTLDGREVDWTWSPGPMPGAVVRLEGPDVRGELRLSAP